MSPKRVLVFGSSGTLGSACLPELTQLGYEPIEIGRDLGPLETIENIDGAVWAQGVNFTGGLTDTTSEAWAEIWDANFEFIVESLGILLKRKSLNRGARLVVISSVWQEISRTQKIAYIASKAAVGGLVRGLAADLGNDGIAINAVLPGVVDSPMTHRNLSKEQIDQIASATPGRRLVTSGDIARTIGFLISANSHGINGQSIIVDGGWSITRNV